MAEPREPMWTHVDAYMAREDNWADSWGIVSPLGRRESLWHFLLLYPFILHIFLCVGLIALLVFAGDMAKRGASGQFAPINAHNLVDLSLQDCHQNTCAFPNG